MSGLESNSQTTPQSSNPLAALANVVDPENMGRSPAEIVDAMPDSKRAKLISELHKAGLLEELQYYWPFWARPKQRTPKCTATGLPWAFWIVQAGRGFGKTRIGVEQERIWSREVPISHIIAPTGSDIHKVILDGPAGIMSCTRPQERPRFQTKDSTLLWPNGHKTLIFSAEEPERLRGPQCYKMWCDELPAWKYPEKTWDNAVFGLRLGSSPQCVITTTPRPIKIYKELLKDPGTVITRGSTIDNKRNLSPRFLAQVLKRYEGTRLYRQEALGELLEDNPGALWTLDMIDADRIDPELFWRDIYPTLTRVVVAVDPAVSSNADSDETGIVTCGRDGARLPHFYVFDDRSCVERPNGWATKAVASYNQWNADRIVGEVNNGGEMVEETIRNVDRNVSYTAVHASRGKITRAEPVSALYEKHRIHHVGVFATMEDQMCNYDPATASFSPDRMDAAVWGVTELMGGGNGVLEYWDELIDAAKHQQAAVRLDPRVQTAEEKADMGLRKLSINSGLVKPAVSTLASGRTTACPSCGNVGLARLADGAWSCGRCGSNGRDEWEGLRSGTSFRK